jgi:hypothetical protein
VAGSYFWGIEDVIVPEPGIAVMTLAIRGLVRSGDITRAGIRSENCGRRNVFDGATKATLSRHVSTASNCKR